MSLIITSFSLSTFLNLPKIFSPKANPPCIINYFTIVKPKTIIFYKFLSLNFYNYFQWILMLSIYDSLGEYSSLKTTPPINVLVSKYS